MNGFELGALPAERLQQFGIEKLAELYAYVRRVGQMKGMLLHDVLLRLEACAVTTCSKLNPHDPLEL